MADEDGRQGRYEVSVTALVSMETAAKINRLAAEKEVSRASILREALRDWFQAREEAPAANDDPYKPGWGKRAMEQVSSL